MSPCVKSCWGVRTELPQCCWTLLLGKSCPSAKPHSEFAVCVSSAFQQFGDGGSWFLDPFLGLPETPPKNTKK
eukprot:1279439-Amphidinium_carterae.1